MINRSKLVSITLLGAICCLVTKALPTLAFASIFSTTHFTKSNLHFIVQNNDLRETHSLPGSFIITHNLALAATDSDATEIVELVDEDENNENLQAAAPFLSQGEILPESLNPDLSDPKQTRVIIYIILSLIPVLFLIPLMLGSRDLIPMDLLPPVEL